MSDLSAFLNPVSLNEEREVVISKRFQDENGNPVPFKIRSLTSEEMDAIVKRATRTIRNKGQVTEQLDSAAMARGVILAGTVEPDFTNEEMCRRYGVLDPGMVPGKMLLAGERAKLSDAIMELSGYNDEDAAEEAKN